MAEIAGIWVCHDEINPIFIHVSGRNTDQIFADYQLTYSGGHEFLFLLTMAYLKNLYK